MKELLQKIRAYNINIKVEKGNLKLHVPSDADVSNILSEIKSNKEELIAYITNMLNQNSKFNVIPRTLKKANYTLSSAQKRLYLLQQFDLTSTTYNMPNIIPLGKEADKGKIENVFKQLINRHESFRTSIIVADQEPVQLISEDIEFELEEISIENTEIENTRNKFIKPFDLSQAPFLRVAIVEVKGEDSFLMIDMHHIISDGISQIILEREFKSLYSGETLSELNLQYKDYSEWQNSKEQQELIRDQEQYWLNKFEGEIPVLNLPTDYVRPLMQSHEGAKVNFVLSKEETEGIKFFTKENDLTLHMSLLSVFSILLSKLSGQDDIVIGTPIAGRNYADLENIVGMFINTLSIRNEVKGEETIPEFVSSLKQTVLGAYENQNYQFEDLVNKVSLERDAGRNPIFDVAINLLNQAEHSGDISGFNNQKQVHKIGISKFDLTVIAFDYGDQILLSFEYCTQLFKAETIDRFIVYFKKIVSQIARKPEIKISAIDILNDEEKQQLLYEFNKTETEYPKDRTIHQLFEEQVEQFPDKIALECKNKTFTYQELNEESNKVANCLRQRNVINEQLVGLIVNRSSEMITGILGILKSGGAYVPIDPEHPKERINHLIKDSGITILLSTESLEKLYDFSGETILLDGAIVNKSSINFNFIKNTSSNLAYVMYTSGSTGQPKGVEVEHKNVVRLVKNTNYFPFSQGHKILQTGAPVFDATTFEIWGSLLNGGCLHIPDNDIILNAELFGKCVKENSITTVWLTSSLFNLLADQDINAFSSLSYLLVGGDVLSVKHINKVKEANKKLVLINGYGPTENTTFSTTFKIEREYLGSIPIGKPISNSTAYILDKHNRIQPIGVPGELLVGGDGIARRYLNNPGLTAEKFIPHPFKEGERLYRTGDLARWLPDGNIEFLGRMDHQVKIRGFRIELGEIESALLKHENIKESVVLAIEKDNEKYLCAYVVCKEGLNHEELRAFISVQLPDYMIPSYFLELESLPLTTNGKVNRKALLSPEVKAGDDYAAPTNEIEEKLLEIWSEVLNIDKEEISVNANFFSIGGHSLKATVLTSNIHKEIGVEFPLREVFLHSTIKSQASQIAKSTKKEFVSIPKAKEQSNYPVSSAQKRLYLLQQFDLTSTVYNMPYVIPVGKEADKSKIEEVFKQLIIRHESFRTSIIVVDSEPVQLISEDVEFEVEELSIDKTEIENLRNKFIKPFDLSKAPILRVAIVDIKGEDSLLMIDMHHIISDGTSHVILEREFQSLYSGETLSELNLQYKDYSQWQNSKEQQERIKNQEQYWLSKFEGEIPVLNLPTDYARPVVQSHEGATVNFALNKEETEGVRFFTEENGLTLYMALLSVLSILLSKLSGQDDIVVGTPIAGRNHADLENIVGMFVNTLSIRSEVKGEETIGDFVSSLKQTVLGVFENQNYQFEDLVSKVSVKRDTSHNPIFDVMFNLLNQAEYSGDISGFNNQEQIHKIGISKFDLTIIAVDFGEQILLNFEYCTKLFKAETINRFITYFKQVVSQIARKPEIKISAIDILTEEEKHQLLYEFNNTKTDYPQDKTIHQLFEEQVEQCPDKLALECKNKTVTYKELNENSNQIAHYLIEKGLKREDIVGIVLDSSYQYVVSMLAVLKAGGAFLPIDKKLPDLRKKYIVENSELKILIHNDISYEKIAPENIESINMQELDVQNYQLTNPSVEINSSNLAYIIYTSGSTGKPKGTLLEHKGIVSENIFWKESLKINPDDRCLQFSNISFDASVWEIYLCLFNGASLYIPDENIKKDTSIFEEYLVENQITVATLPPPYADNLDESVFKNFRLVITAGSETNSKLIEKISKNTWYINAYGPTETSVCATYWDTSEFSKIGKIAIGRPIQNIETYIIDSHLQLQGIGISGELCFSGEGLARGYLKNPELTAEKFIPHPFKEGERLYRTGDLARWLPDGNIEFLGRIDHQVKIRGYRIELGEVESSLLKHENIKESVVLAREDNRDKYLCAYVVTNEGNFNQEEARIFLSRSLPDYMIPPYIVELDKIPLTTNGKVNRKALPSPEINVGNDYMPPSNEIEEKLAEIWSKVLEINNDKISININFFDLGGHSITILKLVKMINIEFDCNISIATIFGLPTIKSIGDYILNGTQEIEEIVKDIDESIFEANERLNLLEDID